MTVARTTETLMPALVEELTGFSAWEVARRLANLPYLTFLDSARSDSQAGRYSYVCIDPFVWLCSRGRVVWQAGPGEVAVRFDADPFVVLQRWLDRYQTLPLPGLPPFQGGAAGLFGYDLCNHLERLPRARVDEFCVPEMAIGLYDLLVAFDHQENRVWAISTGLPETTRRRQKHRARGRLERLRRRLDRPVPAARLAPGLPVTPVCSYPLERLPGLVSNFSREAYLRAIRQGIEYVHAGDCFQVNLAQRLLFPVQLPPLELYGRLRERNPAPFAGYLDLGGFVIASASPERFVRCQAGQVETRPIKGTRPRGLTPEQDARLAAELLGSAKDRAENVMIVDLLRNDLGRVCEYGSVRVEALCRLESYRTVHHLVSEVRGRLRSGLGPVDLLRASFPGGSVTGAPKVRSMEIIAELEPTVRGPYCGSLGWIGFDGGMDTSILIRTFTVGKSWVQFPVGGGLVADSIPEAEYEETLHKAEGLLRALA